MADIVLEHVTKRYPDGTLAVAQHGQVDKTFLRQQVAPLIEGS